MVVEAGKGFMKDMLHEYWVNSLLLIEKLATDSDILRPSFSVLAIQVINIGDW